MKIVRRDGKVYRQQQEPPQVVRAFLGESVADGVSEKRLQKLVELMAAGVSDRSIMKELHLSEYMLREAKRTKYVQRRLLDEARSIANAAYVNSVKSAVRDVEDDDPRTRDAARRYVKSVVESSHGQEEKKKEGWDPSQDEQLYEAARELFRGEGKRIMAEVAEERANPPELGEGEDK